MLNLILLKMFNLLYQAPSNYFMSEKNFTKFKSSVAGEDWDSLMNTHLNLMSPDQAYDNFLNSFKNIFDKCFLAAAHSNAPHRQTKIQPWITFSILKSCRKKSRLLKIYKKTGSTAARKNYITYKNILKQILRSEEKIYYDSQFSAVSSDIRKTWKLINQLINKNSKNNTNNLSLKIAGTTTQNVREIVNGFNEYFVTIGPNLAKQILPPSSSEGATKPKLSINDSMAVMPTDTH